MTEFTTHEYSNRAVDIPAPVSVIAMLVMIAVPVVVFIIPVEVMSGAVLSIPVTTAVSDHVLL
jgi:hypothetical protein